MTKKKGKGRGKTGRGASAPDVDQTAHDVGGRLLVALKDELIAIKNPGNPKQNIWGTLSEVQQDEILDRFGRRIEHELTRGYQAILANGFPAVHAHLAKVIFSSKGIQGQLEIPAGSSHRHELSDFANQPVLVVLTADLDDYLTSMKQVTPDKDQRELELPAAAAGDGADVPNEDTDPRSLSELREQAVAAAASIGEEDIDSSQVETWSRAHLLDYLAWAEGDRALPGDHPAPSAKPH